MRVLVVEDERDLARALAEGIRRDGYAVDTAFTGGSALEKLSSVPYDIVCLDLNLPDIDGREVCRQIQADTDRVDESDVPRVLMLTARDSLADRVAGLDDGADDYLVKPFDLAELLARMRALSRRRSSHTGACRGWSAATGSTSQGGRGLRRTNRSHGSRIRIAAVLHAASR